MYTVTRDQVKLLLRQNEKIAQDVQQTKELLRSERQKISDCGDESERLRAVILRLSNRLSEVNGQVHEADKQLVQLSSRAGQSEYARKMLEQQKYQYEEHLDELREKIAKIENGRSRSVHEYAEVEAKYLRSCELLEKRKQRLAGSEVKMAKLNTALMNARKIEDYWRMANWCKDWEARREEMYEKRAKRLQDAIEFVIRQTRESEKERLRAESRVETLRSQLAVARLYNDDFRHFVEKCIQEINQQWD